jgi:hypothetical protein
MMTNIVLLPLMAYAAVGLTLSLTVHLLSYAGLQFGGTGLFVALHIGIFPLWLPVLWIASKMSGITMWRGGMMSDGTDIGWRSIRPVRRSSRWPIDGGLQSAAPLFERPCGRLWRPVLSHVRCGSRHGAGSGRSRREGVMGRWETLVVGERVKKSARAGRVGKGRHSVAVDL